MKNQAKTLANSRAGLQYLIFLVPTTSIGTKTNYLEPNKYCK